LQRRGKDGFYFSSFAKEEYPGTEGSRSAGGGGWLKNISLFPLQEVFLFFMQLLNRKPVFI
jgi:hypothetical protein